MPQARAGITTACTRPQFIVDFMRETPAIQRFVAAGDAWRYVAFSEDIMRILLTVSMTLALNAIVYGQDSETRLGHPVRREDILALPRRDAAPSLTLQRALKIAETFVKKERLGISSCYLFEARWVSYGTDPKSGAWEFWWVSTKHDSSDIRVAVSLDGKAKRLPIPGAT